MNIKAFFPSGASAIQVNGLHQWDYGQRLEIEAADLPAMLEVHFACPGMTEAVVRSCSAADGVASVAIPDQCLEQSAPVTVWIYEIGETSGTTTKTITLPIIARARPQGGESIPQEASDKYTEAVAALNEAVAQYKSGELVVAEAKHAAEADKADESDKSDFAVEAGTAQNAMGHAERIAELENLSRTYAQSIQNLTVKNVALTQALNTLSARVAALEDGEESEDIEIDMASVTIHNYSSVPLIGTYTNGAGHESEFEIAASNTEVTRSETIEALTGSTVYIRANDGSDEFLSPRIIAVGDNSYGYGTRTDGRYFFAIDNDGVINIVDAMEENTNITLNVSYVDGKAKLYWNSVTSATHYRVRIGSESGYWVDTMSTGYAVTPDECEPNDECWIDAYCNDTLISRSNILVLNKVDVTPVLAYYNGSTSVATVSTGTKDGSIECHCTLWAEDQNETFYVIGAYDIAYMGPPSAPGSVTAFNRREGYIDSDTVGLELAG